MMRQRLILREIPRATPGATRSGAKALLWVLPALAIAVGGGHALGSFPLFAGAAVAQPVSTAHPVFAPEVLSPVVSHGFPQWLRTDAGEASGLRGIETDTDSAQGTVVASSEPVIAVVIDDLGSDAAATRAAIRLPAAVTLSFLPYPQNTPLLAREAAASGHQVLVHVPMEPEGHEYPGPGALLTTLSAAENARRFAADLSRVPGFSGINNHMGSRFTADRAALAPIVAALAARHFFFLDSRTTLNTVVVPLSRASGVASAGRDVFLDDEQSQASVVMQLTLLESVARRNGVAIAIGHPHAVTLAVLADWVKREKGFALVPASTAIRLKSERVMVASAGE